jgi:hypothetical protein
VNVTPARLGTDGMEQSNNILDYHGRYGFQQPAGRLQIVADGTGLTLSDAPFPISRRLTWLVLGGAMFLAAMMLACRSLARGTPLERAELINALAWLGFGWPMLVYARRSAQTTTKLHIAAGRVRIEPPAAIGRSRIDWPITSVRGVIGRTGDYTLNLQQVGNLYIRGRWWDVLVFQRLDKSELEWAMRIIEKHLEQARRDVA